jgi:mRNA interferase RelE/StbE
VSYSVTFSARAARQFRKLPRSAQERIRPVIDALADNPHPPGAKKLEGRHNGWRVRVGVYRVLYLVENDRLLVLVVEVGHRREVYRRP